jgi:putative PEP-CTERM system histidine kinase
MLWVGVVGYGAAALLYAVAAIVIVVGRPRSSRGKLLAAAVATSSVWAGGSAFWLLGAAPAQLFLIGLDVLHLSVWTLCLLTWLGPLSSRRWLVTASAAAGVFALAASWAAGGLFSMSGPNGYPGLVLMALIGLIAVEQVYRNSRDEARQRNTLLCFGVGGIFAVDLFVYAHATLLGAPQPLFWVGRGLANAALFPLIVLGARKQSAWEREPFVSHHVVFYTASLLGVGAYLLAMGIVAYVIRALGQSWSFRLDLAFLGAGIGVLIVVLLSARIRSRFRVFLLKHFYRTKYDYREAWLQLTQSLSHTGDLQQSAANALQGLARIIGSLQGDLWVERDGHRYEWLVSLGRGAPAKIHFERDDPLVTFLSSSGWVVDSEEYAREPERYGTAFGPPDDALLPRDSLVVPLDRQGYLQGFVILAKPAGLRSLNFEDHDILKTAGRQVAAVLAQALVQEKLAETRQFEAVNRLSTFLMHDLKNVVAEQELVLANAQRFRHRADFIDDAFATIRGGTGRMKKVLERLADASRKDRTPGRVDVSKVLMEVRSQCADRSPVPKIDVQAKASWVRMDRDDLASVLVHLVRNAQDATPADGEINIGVSCGPTELVITVSDTGCGMDSEFVRDRLFRPFDSTKGTTGMGIGAYQARNIVQRTGGELDVTSEVGGGTTFTLRLPAAAWLSPYPAAPGA